MPARFDDGEEILSFQVLRSVSQHGLAMASLAALDGHGDEAIDTLLPILEVSRKIQPYSRTLVRDMIGCVIEHNSLATAAFILDTTAVSPAARNRLLRARAPGRRSQGRRPPFVLHGICAQFRGDEHQPGGGYSLFDGPTGPSPRGLRRGSLNVLSPYIYNPHATFNQIGALYADWQEHCGPPPA